MMNTMPRIAYFTLSILLISCGVGPSYQISEDAVEDVYNNIEKVEGRIDELISNGQATEEELYDLREDIEAIKEALDNDLVDIP